MCELSEIVEHLKQNPVFRMSLASKELFHSNMLAWLLESCDSDNNLLSEIAKALAKLFMPKQDSENGYKVLTVLREKSHLDLIIVFLPDNDDFKSYNRIDLENVFQNSGSDDQVLLEKLQKNCRFVVVENKFKSIPDKEQLKKYNKIIEKRIYFKKIKRTKISVDLNEENTTRYLMAPKVALNSCKEELQEELKKECRKWNTVSYEGIRDILKSKIKSDNDKDFTAQFIEYYADFLDNMLELTKDIEEKLNSPNKSAFPDWQDIFKLKKIRIHDFYEKLWFSVLLNKIIEMTGEGKFNRKGSGYTNALGLLDLKIEDKEKHVWYGIQIQNKQLRIVVEPEWGYKWQGECPKEQIIKYCNDILNFMNQQETCPTFGFSNTKDLCSFKDFKYRYIPLENDISIKDLASKINKALTAIQESTLIKFDSAPTEQQ